MIRPVLFVQGSGLIGCRQMVGARGDGISLGQAEVAIGDGGIGVAH